MQTVGRLEPGVTLEDAYVDLTRVQAQLAQLHPETDPALTVRVQSVKSLTVADAGTSLWLLYGAVSLLLLIACANIAAVLLSRAAQRGSEVALRLSLGASRRSIVSQLLMEAFVLALAGAAAGLVVAIGATEAASRLAVDLPRFREIQVEEGVVLYTLACCVAVTLLCGLLPAVRASRRDTRALLAGASRRQVGGGQRVQWALVGSQVALAVTLLSGAALLLRSVRELGRVEPGFDSKGVLAMNVSTAWTETNDEAAFTRWSNAVVDALGSAPGVEAAAVASGLPGLRSAATSEFVFVGGPIEPVSDIVADYRFVSPNYFDVLAIPLLEGRMCRSSEDPGQLTAEVMVNERFADTYSQGGRFLGTRLRWATGDAADPGVEIVGVVGNAREGTLRGEPAPTIYGCDAVAYPGYYLLARVEEETGSATNALRRRLQELDPGRALFGVMPLDDYLSGSFAEERVRTALVGFFALAAVLLAALGLYGTLAHYVGTRRREIGLRMALGADRQRIVTELLQQGMRVASIGALAGLALALAFGRVLRGLLFGVSPTDPLALTGVVALALAATALASLVPSVRASHLDPTQALQDE
jgi:putative ABC transport system permease protein